MSRLWTVQVGYNAHHCNTVTVEADTLDDALEKAIEAANEDAAGWRSTDDCSDSFVDTVCEALAPIHGEKTRFPSPAASPSMASRRS